MEQESFILEDGKSTTIGSNRPVEFEIKTSGGTVIKGVVPANEKLEVTSGGDIVSFDVNIHEITSKPHIL